MTAFDLEAGGGDDDAENYAPLISFLDFVNNSDDTTFAAGLAQRLDIDEFAIYLAMMDLVQNFDDINGPGNNSYLYYDNATSKFTVVPWDMNLAFNGMTVPGREFRGGPGGNPGGAGQGRPNVIVGTPPAGTSGGPGGQMPQPPADGDFVGGAPGGGMSGTNNPLVSRWEANSDFVALQNEAKQRLHAELFAGGVATDILARWVELLETQAIDLVEQATIESESQRVQEQIDAA